MALWKIEDVIPESNIICVSPHYDDFLFFLGGYVLELKSRGLLDTKRFTNISTMSRSNYQEGDEDGNKDRSLPRVQHVIGIRIIEDLECLDELLGQHNYNYRVMGEEESLVRGKGMDGGEGEMEMSFGSYESMEQCDWDILDRMEACIAKLALRDDTAIVLPLSMKGHIDHFVVREAGVRAYQRPGRKAAFYFAEDKPYAGIMTDEESAVSDEFISKYDLTDRVFPGHPHELLRLAHKHYPSQVNPVYDEGVHNRTEQLKQLFQTDKPCDRIFTFKD